MLKPLPSRRLLTAIVLLLLAFASSSALAAPRLRGERKHATHHPTHRRAGRHAQGARRAGRQAAVSGTAAPSSTATAGGAAATTLLGDQAIEPQRDELSGGQAEAFSFQALASGTTAAAHLYIGSANTATTLIVGLYSSVGGQPGALLASGSTPILATSAWSTAPIPSVQLSAGSTYWFAVLGTGGTLRYRDRAHGPCISETSRQARLGALPSLWRTGASYRDCPISGYLTGNSGLPAEPPAPVELLPGPEPPPPPPPLAPIDSALPTIGGTAEEGHTLTATPGTWAGAPTYAYRWELCNASGEACVQVSGATTTSYALSASDVGHTLRVLVTATNGGGSTTATSTATALVVVDPPPPPPPAAPTASFTYAPTSPHVGEPVTFDAAGSECPDGPCTYEWSDDGSPTRPPTPLWPLGSGPSLSFTFSEAGTKYVRLLVTDAAGQTATVEHNVVVTEAEAPPPPPPPPPPAAPANTVLPAISGTTTEGQTLSVSTGTWTASPTGYAYQWEDCNASGESCSGISGASTTSYTLSTSDVGHTLRVIVTATNEGGSTPATSTATALIAAVPPPPPPPPPSEEGCTSTISSVSQVNADLKPGAVVCLAAGTYGALSITTSPSSNATLTAAPGAHVVVNGVNIAASNITVSQLHSTGTINVGSGSPYPGFSHDVIEHNDVGPTNGYGISVMSATSTPSSYITIAYNRIHNTSDTSEGDALRFDGWNHLTVIGNDIYEIKECPSSTCHTDTLQSYQGDVPTEGLTIEKNYSHDNVGAQGLPFLKDGDISNVTIRDNLSLRNTPTNGQVTGIWIDENIHNLLIEKNTYWGTDGSIVQSEGSASNPTATIDRNVMDTLNIKTASAYSYAYTEDYDIFREAPWTYTIGTHSKVETSPTFICSPKCGGGAVSEDDYQLKNNPNNIGIDWNPAEVQYGPTN
jgi:hypothetical protein